MPENNEEPSWVINSVDYINRIRPKIEQLKKDGQVEAKNGFEKIQKADELLNHVDYINTVLTYKHESSLWSDQIVSASGVWLENQIQAVDIDLINLSRASASYQKSCSINHNQIMNEFSETSGSAGTAVFLAAGIDSRFQIIDTAYKPPEPSDVFPINEYRENVLTRLLKLVEPYGQKYYSMIEGSESALERGTPESFAQAAHSIRDCFQSLIEYLAPTQVVQSQPWFELTPGSPTSVSRKSRIRYLFYGSGENVNNDVLKKYDDQAGIAKESLDLCIKRAHDHNPEMTIDEAKASIDQGRSSLLSLLLKYQEFRSQ